MTALVQHDQLKSDYWKSIVAQNVKPVCDYDDALDTFFLYAYSDIDERVIAHYVDGNVAFLYRYSDKEIVGIKIEYFKKSFLPKQRGNVWHLSKTGVELVGIKDFMLKFEEVTRPISTPRPIEGRVCAEPVFA